MFDQHISALDATPLGLEPPHGLVEALLSARDDFAVARHEIGAMQQGIRPFSPQSLAARYAGANLVTRRRFDMMLREAESDARAGLALIIGRHRGHDRGTIAAAHFLGKSLSASLRKLDNLLSPPTPEKPPAPLRQPPINIRISG